MTVYIFEYTIKNRPEYNSEITERMERMGSLVDSFSLREINFAKTRLNILKVVKDRITQKILMILQSMKFVNMPKYPEALF